MSEIAWNLCKQSLADSHTKQQDTSFAFLSNLIIVNQNDIKDLIILFPWPRMLNS